MSTNKIVYHDFMKRDCVATYKKFKFLSLQESARNFGICLAFPQITGQYFSDDRTIKYRP